MSAADKPIEIVEAAPEDLPEILALQKLAFQSEAVEGFVIPPLRQSLPELEREARRSVVLKIELEGTIIASIRVRLEDGTCYLGSLIVHPEHQNRGLGARLIRAAEAAFPQARRYEIFTGGKSARSLYLYGKLGYKSFRIEEINELLSLVYLEKDNRNPKLSARHRKALDELVRLHGDDPKKLALVVCGSVAAGKARADSDVDLYLVVTDEEFERVRAAEGAFYGSWDPDRFAGAEIDGKIVGKRFLVEAVERASEPTRASFEGAYTAFSHDPEIDRLLPQIAAYPEWEREKKIKAFYAFTKHYRYVGEQAFQLGNEYFARRCAIELAFFAARLALAQNRVLFPCHKTLFAAVERCDDLPAGFVESSRRLLEEPSLEAAIDHYELVTGHFGPYDYPDQERISFILDTEWSWFSGVPFVGDW